MTGGLLLAVLLLLPGAVARAGGAGDGALRVTVTVNGRADTGSRPPAVRAGAPVVKRYRLVNRGEAHLYGVRVIDPGVPDGAVRCPRQPLAALRELECVARFRAVPGVHPATVRAEGDIPSLGRRIGANSPSGYTGVAGVLGLTERITVRAGAGAGGAGRAGRAVGATADGTATVTYTVTNRGNLPVLAVRVEDSALRLAPGALDCAGRAGTVPRLAPGASARCTATVRRPPGTHRSTGLATGSDRVTTYDAGGTLAPAPTLTARSSGAFTIVRPVVRGGSGSRGAAGAAGAAGADGAAGVVGARGAVGVPGSRGVPGVSGAAGAAGATGAIGASAGAPDAPAAALPGAAPPRAAAPVPVAPPRSVQQDVQQDVQQGLRQGEQQAVPGTAPGTANQKRVAAVRDDEGFLGRLRRRTREAHRFGVVTMLLLILIPAAVAAALLGNRGK
ncbi:hypothetical protein ACN9M0_17565 [Streptomyces sp. R-07]|uniref:hypothetical protein n=1 Tax=Streptomyces sp. R-07 TaxID=3404052 RepID=UPI003CEA8F65